MESTTHSGLFQLQRVPALRRIHVIDGARNALLLVLEIKDHPQHFPLLQNVEIRLKRSRAMRNLIDCIADELRLLVERRETEGYAKLQTLTVEWVLLDGGDNEAWLREHVGDLVAVCTSDWAVDTDPPADAPLDVAADPDVGASDASSDSWV